MIAAMKRRDLIALLGGAAAQGAVFAAALRSWQQANPDRDSHHKNASLHPSAPPKSAFL